jgi:glycosyltransferase involved in cell wall biosynthesis
MRIGMMADLYKPHVSGVTNYIAINKEHMENAGHEVYVFTFGEEGNSDGETNVIHSPGLPISDTGYYLNVRYSSRAQELLESMDVVHVHHPFVSGSLALRYCRPIGVPIVFTNHTRYDLYAKAYMPIIGDALGEPALRAYLPSFCRACNLVISPSEGMREVLKRIGVDVPIEVVPNGVDIKPFLEPGVPQDRGIFDFQPEDVILIYMGRLGPEKNLPFLLRAFAGVSQAFNQTKLLIIGEGPERKNLQERVRLLGIEKSVVFTGLVSYDQMPKYLAMGDAFVTASVTEVHPLSLIESMATGLPALGIQSPGIGDTVKDGVTGYLIKQEDLAGFTASMARLVFDRETSRRMGIAAQKLVKKYAIENTTQLMLLQYEKVITETPKRKSSFWNRMRRVGRRTGK